MSTLNQPATPEVDQQNKPEILPVPKPDQQPKDPQALEAARQAEAQQESVRQTADSKQIEQIRSGLNPDATKPQKPSEQQSPTELYEKLLKPKMDSVINAWGLRPAIEDCRSLLSQSNQETRAKTEKSVVKKLLKEFKKIPASTWAFFPEAMAQEKAANCSGAAMILGHILNEELKIKAEQANPWNHTVNIVTYSDGKTQYVDSRNNKIHDLELEECVEEKDGFKVYRVKKGGLRYGLLPVASHEHTSSLNLMTNTVSLINESQKDQKAAKTMAEHGSALNSEFAIRYSDIHHTANPDTDPKWIAEKRSSSRRKYLTGIPILGRFL